MRVIIDKRDQIRGGFRFDADGNRVIMIATEDGPVEAVIVDEDDGHFYLETGGNHEIPRSQ